MNILIAEDDPTSLQILESMLKKWGHEVTVTHNGAEAWAELERTRVHQIVILDWMMPGLEGVEVCRRIRERDREDPTYIIMLTSRGVKDDVISGLAAGANDYIVKPFAADELRARLQVGQRVWGLQDKLARRARDLQAANDRINDDIKAAAAIQKSLLPSAPPEIDNVKVAWIYDACETVAGDSFNIFRLDERRVGVYVLDVSGHGVQAALLSVSLSRVLTPHPQQGGILKRIIDAPPHYEVAAPCEVAALLNRCFPVMAQSGQYFTFLYGILDHQQGTFRFVRAGHPGPIQIAGSTVSVHNQMGGVPIGIVEHYPYEEAVLRLQRGDKLLLYTDGLMETRNLWEEEFGEERMMSELLAASESKLDIAAIVDRLRRRVSDYRDGRPQEDDITMLGIQMF